MATNLQPVAIDGTVTKPRRVQFAAYDARSFPAPVRSLLKAYRTTLTTVGQNLLAFNDSFDGSKRRQPYRWIDAKHVTHNYAGFYRRHLEEQYAALEVQIVDHYAASGESGLEDALGVLDDSRTALFDFYVGHFPAPVAPAPAPVRAPRYDTNGDRNGNR
jgi:hypothetical protein